MTTPAPSRDRQVRNVGHECRFISVLLDFIWRQLDVGTRVVSHAFDMGDEWPPERVEKVAGSTVYYWTITEENKRAASS